MMAGMSIDMFIEPENDPRPDPPGTAGELATLWSGRCLTRGAGRC